MLIEQTLDVAGIERYYLLYIPAGRVPAGGWPLVLAFHGGGSCPLDMARFCGLAETAERHRFAVAYPAGSGTHPEYLTWNAGKCCGHASRRELDDVGFVGQLLSHAPQQAPINQQRVYATGMSNGGMMCYRAACSLSGRIAAIAPVAGCLAFAPPRLERAVPVLHFHGTEDEFVPYHGGRGSRSLRQVDFLSVAETLASWATACGVPVTRSERMPIFPAPRGDSPHQEKAGKNDPGKNGSPAPLLNEQGLAAFAVIHAIRQGEPLLSEITIDGGGHTWPGQAPQLCFLGRTLLNLSANERMWAFFERHSLARSY